MNKNKRAFNFYTIQKRKKTRENLLQRNVLQHQQFLGYAKPLISDICCCSQPLFGEERELQWFVALQKIMTKCCPSL